MLSILSVILLSNFGFAQIQSGEVVYKVDFTMDIKKTVDTMQAPDTMKDFFKKYFHKTKKTAPYLSYRLSFTKNEAIFQTRTTMKNDNGMDLNQTSSTLGTKGVFYVNTKADLRLHKKKVLNKYWRIEKEISAIDWHVGKETKKIQGYRCRKATTIFHSSHGDWEITAWFCPEIPFKYGPMDYAGLPGLILELNHVHSRFYADRIKLSQKAKTIQKPTKGKLVSRAEYNKEIKKRSYTLKNNR